jgi:hypothetical protein
MNSNILEKNTFFVLFSYLVFWSILDFILPSCLSNEYKQINFSDILIVHKYKIDILNDKYFWLTPIGVFIKTFVQIICTACLFFIGIKIYKFNLHFGSLLIIVILAHSIFMLQFIFEFIYLRLNWDYLKDLKKENFSLFSISYFFYIFKIKFNHYFIYCFQILNIFELAFWFILCILFSKFLSISKLVSFYFVVCCYIFPLILWISIVTLMSIII